MSKTARPEGTSIVQQGIGARMRWVREARELSQTELSAMLGVDPSTLNKIEKGARAPSVFNVIAVANRLRVSADFLLRGLLTAQTDPGLALVLVARHPELAPQHARMAPSTDMDPVGDTPGRNGRQW